MNIVIGGKKIMNEYENIEGINCPKKENEKKEIIVVKENSKIINFFVEFWRDNKKKLLVIGGIGVTVVGTALAIDNVNQRQYIKALTEKVLNQKNKMKYLYKQNNIKNKRIEVLENMCMQKDKFFKKFISEGTRRGNSECARQLAYRRVYINENS